MKSFVKRYQIIFFFVLTFLLSWFPWYSRIAPEVMAMGPSLAALIIVIITGGKKGVIDWLRPFVHWRVNLRYWLIALCGTAVMYLTGVGVFILFGGKTPPFTMIKDELNLIPLYLVMVVLMPWNGPVGEEFGWRGFALPKLQEKYSPLVASLMIGAVWGLWHLPSFFASQGVISAIVSALGFGFIVPYTLGTIANSILMTWLYNKSKGSALIAGIIWHAGINFWAPVLLSDSSLVAAQQGTHLPTIVPALYLTVLGVQVVVSVIVTIGSKGGLGSEVQI